MTSFRTAAALALLTLPLGLTSCMSCSTRQDPDVLREKTAQTTANLKQDAKSVAQGIREGWSRNNQLDLNRASTKELVSLPGVSQRTAERMVENRPYATTEELVTKHVLSLAEYNRIKAKVTVKK